MLRRAQCWRRVLTAAASNPQCPHFVPGKSFATFPSKAFAGVSDADIDRHFIVHDLGWPLEVPEAEPATAAQTLWNSAAKNPDKLIAAVEAWKTEGKDVTRDLINALLVKLCARQHYLRGYRLMDWVLQKAPYDILDFDKALLLHFSAVQRKDRRSRNLFKELAEKTGGAYENILRAHANLNMRDKAEALFEEMKLAKVATTAEPYDMMMGLYLRLDDPESAKKIYSELEESGISPSAYTYKTLNAYKDTLKMEGLDDKIRAFLDSLGSSNLKGRDWKCCILLNAAVGREQEVQRLWTEMKQEAFIPDAYYTIAAEAYSILGDMSRFEELSAEMASRNGGIQDSQCFPMLKIYSQKGMMKEAEALVKQVSEAGQKLGFRSYHYLVAGYMKQRRTGKALEKFHESLEKCGTLPFYFTVLLAMEAYGKMSNLKAAESLMARISKTDMRVDIRLYNALLKVYVATNKPVYAIEERMRAAKVVQDAETKVLLSKVKILV